MQNDPTINLIILGGLGALIFLILLIGLKGKRKKSVVAADVKTGAAGEKTRLYESQDDIPKLPRNETLYQIIQNNSLVVNNILFDLNYVLDEIAALMRSDVNSQKLEVLFDIDENVPTHIIGSPKRLSRILINLIENSVKYSDAGIVRLSIRQVSTDGTNCTLAFEVSDQGRGMTKKEVDTLFADPKTREAAGVMPLGFYIANALIESEGGQTTVKTMPGAGTTVAFTLSFKLRQTHKKLRKKVPSQSCRELKVAVVSPHEETGKLLRRYLEPYVADVEIIEAGAGTLHPERFEGAEMVLIDHHLITTPLAHALKANGTWLIALQSVLDTAGAKDAQLHYAADYLLSIPFSRVHVIEMLTVFYGEATEEESAESAEETTEEQNFDTFVSDAQIPVAANISKKDFNRFAGAKLLIVEDNPINQRVIKGLLGDSGIHLYFAENGLEAIDVVEEEAPFDLVLMDINMPVLDGIETTRRLREHKQYDDMPIVAFTGLNLKDQIERMQEAGMNAHMAKPLNIGRVYSVFNHFLAKRAAA